MRVARTAASLAAAPLLLLLGTALRPAGACTSIIIGREASADGSIFIARSDDGEDAHTDTNHLVYHPPREAPALFRSNINRLALELPGPGLAYFGWPNIRADPAQGRNASGESNGVNSAGVALSATESIYNKPEALKADPYKKEDGIIEDAIPSLLLPQMRSAREGAALLGQLVSERGAGEGFGVLFADGREAWYLETASGHHWLAQRIPRHAVFVSANQGRFQEVDLADQSSAIASPGLVEFATKAGLYDPDAGRPFNFTAAFMVDAPHDTTYDYPRIHEMQGLFGGPNARIVGMPVFLRPARKVQPRDVFQAMRLHFEGTPHDAYMLQNPREPFRPIVLLRTGLAHVTQVRPTGSGLPDGLSVINHVALGTSALSPFIPYYKGLPPGAIPRELTTPLSQPDPTSLFWKARRLQALVFQDWPLLEPAAAAAIRAFEADIHVRQAPAMERRYAKATERGDEAAAAAELAQFTRAVVRQAAGLLERLARQAAKELGLGGVPPDSVLVKMLDTAFETYPFMPATDAARVRPLLRAGAVARASGTGGVAAVA